MKRVKKEKISWKSINEKKKKTYDHLKKFFETPHIKKLETI